MTQINGDQAFAFGALNAGVKVVTSYPGSPSSGTVQHLIKLAKSFDFYVEWSVNEKVAAEVAIGASIAGKRALICVKSVGMNVMVDPLMALNLTPVNGGLVILLGDDPGGYGSQNDQDTRPLVSMLEMPLLEPATPGAAYRMMLEAFDLSQQYQIPIIIRETRSFSQYTEELENIELKHDPVDLGLANEPMRFVPVPENAVEKHLNLQQQISLFRSWSENSVYNHISGQGKSGIISVGFAVTKLLEVLDNNLPDDVLLFSLGTLYPLPSNKIARFLSNVNKVLIIEEGLPYIENYIKAIAHDHQSGVEIIGKQSGHIPSVGELFRWQIQKALQQFIPEFQPVNNFIVENEANEYPSITDHCKGCRYEEVLESIDNAAHQLGKKPLYFGDPGCIFLVAEKLLAKYAIGSAVGLASGLIKAGISQPVVALFGDSGFFHTTIPSIINAAYNNSKFLMVLLDNAAALTSGSQPTPAVGRDALGNVAPTVDFEKIAVACGVEYVKTVPIDQADELSSTFSEALQSNKLSLVIVKIPLSE